jgi:hypothetical protein
MSRGVLQLQVATVSGTVEATFYRQFIFLWLGWGRGQKFVAFGRAVGLFWRNVTRGRGWGDNFTPKSCDIYGRPSTENPLNHTRESFQYFPNAEWLLSSGRSIRCVCFITGQVITMCFYTPAYTPRREMGWRSMHSSLKLRSHNHNVFGNFLNWQVLWSVYVFLQWLSFFKDTCTLHYKFEFSIPVLCLKR